MNRDDLEARLMVATGNHLLRAANTRGGVVAGFHERLLGSLGGNRVQGGRQGRRFVAKQTVFREFNRIVGDLIPRIRTALTEVEQSGCLFAETEVYVDEGIHEEFIAFRSFSDVYELRRAAICVDAALELRKLSAVQQLLVCKFNLVQQSASLARTAMNYQHELGKTLEAQTLRTEIDEAEQSLEQIKKRFDRRAISMLTSWNPDPILRWHSAFPIDLPESATCEELLLSAGLYESLADEIFQPYEVDPRRVLGNRERCEDALRFYSDAGEAYLLLAAWLRCLATIDDYRRCNVCYRHLGRGMKHFCRVHVKRSSERQPTRDLHISTLYRPLIKSFLTETGIIRGVGKRQPAPDLIARMLSEAVRHRLPPDLLMPAAFLAALLRGLWPAVTPVLEAQIESHFVSLLEILSSPFREDRFPSLQAKAQNNQARRNATKLLSWETFFRTWFGSMASIGHKLSEDLGRDMDHPSVRHQVVSPSDIALDLAHYRVWTLADEMFDAYAYLNLATVSRLRGSEGAQGALVSYSDIGLELGASGEAVRRTFKFAISSDRDKPRRERVLPAGVARARQAIADAERCARAPQGLDARA